MKKYSRDVVIIHGARRRELPLPKKPFQKVWTKMEGKGSVHNLPWRKLDRWDHNYIEKINLFHWDKPNRRWDHWTGHIDMQLKVEFLFIVLNIAFVQEDKVLSDQDDPLLHLCLQQQLVNVRGECIHIWYGPIPKLGMWHVTSSCVFQANKWLGLQLIKQTACDVVAKVQRSQFSTALLTYGFTK